MSWFKVDDLFFSHRKVLALNDGPCADTAVALWVKAGSWCGANLADGDLPTSVLETLVRRGAIKAADELVRVGLWSKTEGGYQFRAWDEYQPTKADVLTKRKKTAEKVAGWRGKKPACNPVTSESHSECNHDVTPPPSRPVPSPVDTTYPSADAVAQTISLEAHVQAEYVRRFNLALPGKQLPMAARGLPGMGHTVWGELARIVVDVAGCAALFDAAFADSFVVGAGYTPNAIKGSADRLLAVGARDANGAALASLPAIGTGGGTLAPVSQVVQAIEGRLRAAQAEAWRLAGEDGVVEARAVVQRIQAELRAANAARDSQRGAA